MTFAHCSTPYKFMIRMLEEFMGAEEFRTGIYDFLSRYEYGNAVTADLWRELEMASSQNLSIRSQSF